MKILVLGANGFIGNHLCQYLVSKKHHVIMFNKHVDVLKDNKLYDYIKDISPHVLINCITFGGKKEILSNDLHFAIDNLILFSNIFKASKYFKKFINIGSGAEFLEDKNTNLDFISEVSIWEKYPNFGAYASSKNIIARLCDITDNYYTLRLFGCFGQNEPAFRIFTAYKNSLLNNTVFQLSDKYFDNFFIEDFCKVIEYFINYNPAIKDINCVYTEKFKLSQQLELLSFVNNWPINFKIKETGTNYTGCSKNLESLNLNLVGLTSGLKTYK